MQAEFFFPPQVLEEVLEVVLVGDLCVDVEEAEAGFFGHGRDHSPEAAVHVFLVDCEVGVLCAPLFRLQRDLREDDFVAVNDLPSRSFLFVYFASTAQHCSV